MVKINDKTHQISVKIGDKKDDVHFVDISVILHDDKKQKSPEILLEVEHADHMKPGHTHVFKMAVPPCGNLGPISEIELWRENSEDPSQWFCEVVIVKDLRNDESSYFPIQRWVKSGKKYCIPKNDTSLPQDDPHVEQRKGELETKRAQYIYAQETPGGPVGLGRDALPEDERFSHHYLEAVMSLKNEGERLEKLGSYEDLERFYAPNPFSVPRSKQFDLSDKWVGAQRVAGVNPLVIELCTEIPEKLPVTDDMLKPFLEDLTLQQAIDSKRLFKTDYSILEGVSQAVKEITQSAVDQHLCAPITLWFLSGQNTLLPVAIQLEQKPGPNNPVFLPSDPPMTWKIVKMWLNHADASVHQPMKHLGLTHLLFGGVCLAMHRNLAYNHPVFRLLSPHFLFLLAINNLGLGLLLSQDGGAIVDESRTGGKVGTALLINKGLAGWRLDVQGCLPRELEERKLLDKNVLPNYPYRDDGLLVYKAIENYVTKIVEHYYDTPSKLEKDVELQAWIRDLAKPYSKDGEGGLGLKGVPNDGEFRTNKEVIDTLTSIIFTCSAQHAAVNFGQYDNYAYPPNYPALLKGTPPQDKSAREEKDLVNLLPSVASINTTMTVTRTLAMRATKSLGDWDWDFRYQYDDAAVKAEEKFREELKKVSGIVKGRNEDRSSCYFYDYLDPAQIPNSISI